MARRRRRRSKKRDTQGHDPERLTGLLERLQDWVPIQPEDRIKLETHSKESIGRVMDLIAPIGKGQRVLLTSPPKAGKTTILKGISKAVSENHPEVEQIVLLVDERPEEATDFKRSLNVKVEVSTTDRTPKEHIALAETVFADAAEMLYEGKDVMILMDSLTRLARAYNTVFANSGRTLSGGITAGALDRPRQLFGLARNFEDGGSLTIVATALVETGSQMDEVIFQEFKGTGNCELVLTRKLSERRLFPAVDIAASGTRQEELLFDETEVQKNPELRRKLAGMGETESLDWLLKRIVKTRTNYELLRSL